MHVLLISLDLFDRRSSHCIANRHTNIDVSLELHDCAKVTPFYIDNSVTIVGVQSNDVPLGRNLYWIRIMKRNIDAFNINFIQLLFC
jgi:hypothetical protein